MVLAAVAVGLAVVLVASGSVPDNGWLRVANVVVGSALGLAAAMSLAVRVGQIRRLQRRDAALLAGLPDAVVRLDRAGAVTFANPAAHALLGPAVDGAPSVLRDLLDHGTGAADELALPERVISVDWTAVTLDEEHDTALTLLLVRDAAPRLTALQQATQLAESRREAALQRHYLDVLERPCAPRCPACSDWTSAPPTSPRRRAPPPAGTSTTPSCCPTGASTCSCSTRSDTAWRPHATRSAWCTPPGY